MRVGITLAIILMYSIGVLAQESSTTLSDFEGVWDVDLERSYTKAGRDKVADYSIRIAEVNGTLIMMYQFSFDGEVSKILEEFILDKKSHKYQRKSSPIQRNTFFDFGYFLSTRSYKASLKKGRLRISFRPFPPSAGLSAYLDQRTLELSEDKKSLRIENRILSSSVRDVGKRDVKTLFLVRAD